jgi:hypothetical protein
MSTSSKSLSAAEQLFSEWLSSDHRRDYRDRYQNPERNTKIFDRAIEICKADAAILALSHFTIALEEFQTAEDWHVVPLKQVTVDDKFIAWIQGQNRVSLVSTILAAGPRSDLARTYAAACRKWNYTPVYFPPADVTATELEDFEQQLNAMPLSEQKKRYVLEGNGKGSFKWFMDRLEAYRKYQEEAPRS